VQISIPNRPRNHRQTRRATTISLRMGRPFERACRLPSEIHGHCNVPQQQQLQLGRWVKNQRQQYKVPRGDIVMTLSRIRIGKLGLNGIPHRLGRPFERACRLSQNQRALQCSSKYSENSKLANGSNQETIQVAPRRKDIVYDALPYPGIGKHGFEWEFPHRLGRL
jgi:hypothetical protein